MPNNPKQSKADAQQLGRYRRAIMERKRERERQDALLRQRLSAARPAKSAPGRGSVEMRPDSRMIGRERVLADDGSIQVVATTAPTLLRLAHHRQRAATSFVRDFEAAMGGLHSAPLEWKPRGTGGDYAHTRRIEATRRIVEAKRHIGNGFHIMVAVLVCGVPIGEIATGAKVATAETQRDLNDALDRASDIYAPGRGWLPKWMTRLEALCARETLTIMAWHAECTSS